VLFDTEASELVWRSADALRYAESVSPDAHIAERAGPRTTVVIRIQGTNLVDFDDETLSHQLANAAGTGADIVIRLED
jgi:hypothetical protein